MGAPEPKNSPKFDVDETLTPLPVVPPAGIAVPLNAVRAPVTDSDVPVAAPRTGVTSVGDVEKTRLVEVVPVAPAAE